MNEFNKFRREVRRAIANYMRSEGCDCCRSSDHQDNKDVLGKLLKVRKYSDGSGYDFYKYADKEANDEAGKRD